MAVGAINPFTAAAEQPPPPTEHAQPDMQVAPFGESAQPNPLPKVDSELRQIAEADVCGFKYPS
jgi:hypothetical protein